MRRIHLLLLAILLAVASPAQGQESMPYRLRPLTLEDYLESATAILEGASAESDDQHLLCNLARTMQAEIVYRGWLPLGHDLEPALSVLRILSDHYCFVEIDPHFWYALVFTAWANSGIDLTVEPTEYEEFTVEAAPQNLDGDGTEEWILHIQQGEQYEGYVVLRRNGDGLYTAVENPLPHLFPFLRYEIDSFVFDPQQAGTLRTLSFSDVNDDGLHEWIVLLEDADWYSNAGRLYVLGWRDGGLVDLGSETLSFQEPFSSEEMNWEFDNLDEDPAIEIGRPRPMVDNWGCRWTQTITFDWDGSQYVHTDEPRSEFPDTPGCIRRQAEAAMWEHDWETAIELYERLPRTGDPAGEGGEPPGLSSEDNHRNYSDVRLALAYILDGQAERGIELLRALATLTTSEFVLPEYVRHLLAAYQQNPTSVGVCAAAYDFVMEDGYYFWFTNYANLEVGFTADNQIYGQGMYSPPPASPDRGGCDVAFIIQQLLDDHAFHTDTPLPQQVGALGFPIGYSQETDLNGDEQAEWIVWTALIQLEPIFFAPEGESYHVSRPYVNFYPPNSQNRVAVWQLPNGETALVNLDYAVQFRQHYADYGLPVEIGCPRIEGQTYGPDVRLPDSPGRFGLWRLVDGELMLMVDGPLCEILDFESFFPGGPGSRTLRGWIENLGWTSDGNIYFPAAYTWDDLHQTYLPPAPPTATPGPTATAYVPPPYLPTSIAVSLRELQQGNAQAALVQVTEGLAIPGVESQSGYAMLRYLGALALEALDRPEEALAEYVALYEAAPESAWGMFAALHLEPVE